MFITGTDEHGEKIATSAAAAGKEPKEFVDSIAEEYKSLWHDLDISYDSFVRTTSDNHEKVRFKNQKSGKVMRHSGLGAGLCKFGVRVLDLLCDTVLYFPFSKQLRPEGPPCCRACICNAVSDNGFFLGLVKIVESDCIAVDIC